uniref:Uncharacterized protein AlNc14C25G2463 n=1 Tax=Albugo laibachii Nc14 TaxID=890382 RepID=F0W6G3_9STRA|nr:conserved hypothetical protein [Albugo laibachii Nc14]|eukprot:CCA16708.1 conserved hypothetical protein [Albugo laibachii Nc14]
MASQYQSALWQKNISSIPQVNMDMPVQSDPAEQLRALICGETHPMSVLNPMTREFLKNTALGNACRGSFNLDPKIINLNQNCYGTAIKPVLQAQAHFVDRMEMNPDRFFRKECPRLLRSAAGELARFLGTNHNDVVFVTNATTGMNAVLRSVDLQEGDEVLCLDLTYPAVLNTLRHLCYCTQEFVELKVVDVQLPIDTYEIGEKLISMFHARNIPVLVDGASAPGQLPLNLKEIGADFYVGTCYKWLFGSKSCSFLYVSKEFQNSVQPVVTSLGYGQGFIEDFAIQGTRDECNFLTIITALDCYRSIGPDRIYAHNKALMDWASAYLANLWSTHELLPSWQRAPFVSNIQLPIDLADVQCGKALTQDSITSMCNVLMDFLMDRFGILVRIAFFQGAFFVRISAQIYNERSDYEQLGAAILDITRGKSLCDYLSDLII